MASFITGSTGLGTGPHLDFRVYDVASNTYLNPSDFTDVLTVGGKPLTEQFRMTSGFGPRVAPTSGASTDHKGMDYATPAGTRVDIAGGKHLATFDTPKGGVMSQFAFQRDGKNYDLLFLHGDREGNPITSQGAVTDFDYSTLGTSPVSGEMLGEVVDSKGVPVEPTPQQAEAKERSENYKNMSKAQLDAAYDKLRSDPVKAREEGMKMHKAFFGKL